MLHWLKLILNFNQDPALFWQKQILTGLLVIKIYSNRTMKISLFNYSMLGYISPITTSLPYIYRRNSFPTHIFKPNPLIKLLKDFQSSLIKKFTPPFYLSPFYLSLSIYLSIYLSISSIYLIFSVLISGVKLLLFHNLFKKWWWTAIYVYFLPCINLFISLPLNSAIRRMGNAPNILWLGYKEKIRVSTLIYILLHTFQNFSRLLVSELIINL